MCRRTWDLCDSGKEFKRLKLRITDKPLSWGKLTFFAAVRPYSRYQLHSVAVLLYGLFTAVLISFSQLSTKHTWFAVCLVLWCDTLIKNNWSVELISNEFSGASAPFSAAILHTVTFPFSKTAQMWKKKLTPLKAQLVDNSIFVRINEQLRSFEANKTLKGVLILLTKGPGWVESLKAWRNKDEIFSVLHLCCHSWKTDWLTCRFVLFIHTLCSVSMRQLAWRLLL